MPRKRHYWLLKSEPQAFSFADLQAAPDSTTPWDGVRNYQARNMLRDDLQPGDGVLYYHSNSKPPGVVGIAEVVRGGYPDPTQFDPKHPYHDPNADPENPRWYVVDVQARAALDDILPLDVLKGRSKLSKMALVQRGQRLSVQPVTPAEWREILRMGGLENPIEGTG